MRTPSESFGNEAQLEEYDEWMRQVEKVQLAELPGLERCENISHVSQERIRGIRADPSGHWAGLSEETIRPMVIETKLKNREKRKYGLFLQLQKRTPLDSATSHRVSVRGTQALQAQAGKYGIGTEAIEMRETVAQLAFLDHEKAEFAKFERNREKQKVKGSSQHQKEIEQLSETCMSQNEGGTATSPDGAQANNSKALDLSGAASKISSTGRGARGEARVSDSKLQMPTSLALSRGFGGATLSQMMGIGDDEQLVKRLVSLSPESSMFDKRPEFSPGETTWETLKNMPLD
ncbi:hypothetical protein VE03_02662 [Pseudogymnoascus sp. 23342-1-I1]|nr:hypothetical protein VE03_02662 [Pseudogymnoascus sp. 23342-1-I1]